MVEPLLADLTSRPDVIAEVVAPNRIRVSLLGSYNRDAMELAIVLRVRAWEAAHRSSGVVVEIEPD